MSAAELVPTECTALEVSEPVYGTTVLALPEAMAMDEWVQLGGQLKAAHNSTAWWLGDWLVFAFARWTETHERAAVLQHLAELGFEHETIDRYRRVCELFPPTLRHESLSWSHHMEVASLDLEEAVELLVVAHDQGWSTRRLRDAVKAARAIEVRGWELADDPPEVQAITVKFKGQPPSPVMAERLARGIERTLRELRLDGDVKVRER